MDDLRLILALMGIGVILAVYVWTRVQQQPRKGRARRVPPGAARPAEEPDDADVEQELARMEQLVSEQESETPSVDSERLLVISVVAEEGAPFQGEDLSKALEHNGLQYGDRGIYHRLVIQGGKQSEVFGVANLVKPGTFPQQDMDRFATPGITLFLQLPCAIDAVEAFDDFVNTAERLAVELAGVLRDEKHNVLTHQALMQVRETLVAARIRPKVAS